MDATFAEIAENVAGSIVDTYLTPNKTFPELHDMAQRGALVPLHEFSIACHEELTRLGELQQPENGRRERWKLR